MSDYQLYHGDCLDIMPTLKAGSVDAIITDLPYGTTACAWDEVIPFVPMWKEVKRLLKQRGVFVTTASQPFTSVLIMSNLKWFKYELIWNKCRGYGPGLAKYRPMPSFENLLVFGSGVVTYNPQMREGKPYKKINSKEFQAHGENGHKLGYKPNYVSESDGDRYPLSVIDISWSPSETDHPTQKPIALFEYLIATYTNSGDMVLDFCMGSGTTGEAALRLGRKFIGIEKDAGYFAIAERRLAQAQPPLFVLDAAQVEAV